MYGTDIRQGRRRSEVGGRRSEGGNRKAEIGSRDGGGLSEGETERLREVEGDGSWKSEDGNRRKAVRYWRDKVRGGVGRLSEGGRGRLRDWERSEGGEWDVGGRKLGRRGLSEGRGGGLRYWERSEGGEWEVEDGSRDGGMSRREGERGSEREK